MSSSLRGLARLVNRVMTPKRKRLVQFWLVTVGMSGRAPLRDAVWYSVAWARRRSLLAGSNRAT
jgi:hypothetical protein